MYRYYQAENLKTKRTFISRMQYLSPGSILAIAILLQRGYFVQTAYNWWYAVFLIAMIALNSCLLMRVDQKKKNKAVLLLPIDLKKVFYAKIGVGIKNLSISTGVLCLGATLGSYVFSGLQPLDLKWIAGIEAWSVIVLTSIWMIPFFYIFSMKFGVFLNALFGFVIGIVGILTATKEIWWMNPFGYTPRAICPILHILPNGLNAIPGSETFTPELLESSSIAISIIISIILFLLFSYLSASWFAKREAAA